MHKHPRDRLRQERHVATGRARNRGYRLPWRLESLHAFGSSKRLYNGSILSRIFRRESLCWSACKNTIIHRKRSGSKLSNSGNDGKTFNGTRHSKHIHTAKPNLRRLNFKCAQFLAIRNIVFRKKRTILKSLGATSTSHAGSIVQQSRRYSFVVKTSSWYTNHSGFLQICQKAAE